MKTNEKSTGHGPFVKKILINLAHTICQYAELTDESSCFLLGTSALQSVCEADAALRSVLPHISSVFLLDDSAISASSSIVVFPSPCGNDPKVPDCYQMIREECWICI